MSGKICRVAALILASGYGSRYGSNKLLEEYRGKPLFQIALEKALGSGADRILLVTRYGEIYDWAREQRSDVELIWNRHPERGISESIKLGIKKAWDTEGCVVLVSDQPELCSQSLQRMVLSFRRDPDSIYVCSDGERKGNPALFPRRYYEELMRLSGDQGGKKIIKKYPDKVREIPVGRRTELMDIDKQADKTFLERLSAAQKGGSVKLLEERIKNDGKALSRTVLKVDSFINHQVDPEFMDAIGRDFAAHFKEFGITKVFTIESSGIAPALMAARYLGVPMVILKKQTSKILSEEVYQTRVTSFTKGNSYELTLFRKYISPDDKILLIDDFLANGEAAAGASRLIEEAGAKLSGIGILIEKSFQKGRKRLADAGYYVYSQARIGRLGRDVIEFLPEDAPVLEGADESELL